MPDALPPALILVRPQLGENIGAAARAMKNFGLSELRLVAPQVPWPNEKAVHLSSGATEILDTARLYADSSAAFADIEVLYATTGRNRDMVKPVLTPREAAKRMRRDAAEGRRVGILFGPERTGLESYEVNLSDAIVTIPTVPGFFSLNIAQSAVVMCYEWFQAEAEVAAEKLDLGRSQPATKAELEGFFAHLEEELAAHDFFKDAGKRPGMMQNIRNFFVRGAPTGQDVRTWRGIVRALVWRGSYK